MLPSLGDAADGVLSTSMWGETLDNPANRTFVAEHIKAHGHIPSLFAATGYDGALLIDAALKLTGGKVDDKNALIHALEVAQFPSVRGNFRFNTNHFPIQDYYLLRVGRNEKGEAVNQVVATVAKDVQDSYVHECAMK
jgi:branched-chain amino acid transport system substrate-binding protein